MLQDVFIFFSSESFHYILQVKIKKIIIIFEFFIKLRWSNSINLKIIQDI